VKTAVLRALIWDVDGTIAETERDGHRVAFNGAFEEAGLPWRWSPEAYGPLLQVTGGRQRILHDMAQRSEAPTEPVEREALARRLHARKNELYAERVAAGLLSPRPGVLRLMDEAQQQGVLLAVATTTSTSNVQALFASLFGPDWRARFAAVVCAEDAPQLKPNPQVYQVALQRLGIQADEALALEDSPNGLLAARAAGLACGITRSAYFMHASYPGAAWVQADLDTPQRMTLDHIRDGLSVNIAPS
jgi:HAD superfamily hydrolase (TIGR01509 family)